MIKATITGSICITDVRDQKEDRGGEFIYERKILMSITPFIGLHISCGEFQETVKSVSLDAITGELSLWMGHETFDDDDDEIEPFLNCLARLYVEDGFDLFTRNRDSFELEPFKPAPTPGAQQGDVTNGKED